MSRGPQPIPAIDYVSASDLTDEIRRHLRTLSVVLKRGPGETVMTGRKTEITKIDVDTVEDDLSRAMADLEVLQGQLATTKPARKGRKG